MTTPTSRKEPFFRRLASSFGRLDIVTKIVLVAFIIAGLATGIVAFSYVRFFVENAPAGVLPGLAVHQEASGDGEQVQQLSEETFRYTVPNAWDGSSRVNVLVMGLDARDWQASTDAPRTDTMIVLTFDPVTKTAGMLSIPRDLWVEIPGFGHDKINNAYALGEGNRLPGGGAGLAVATVEQLLGITINYYAQIDFVAFERFIDVIGGVKLDVPSDIRVQLIGEEQTRLIPSGRQVLNGAYALAYARNRHEGDGDFDRARRQQQIILAIRQQLARDDVRAIVLNNTLQIYEMLASGINTNMSLGEAVSLGWAVKDINLENIEQAVIAPPNYVTIDTSPDGLSILKPISENIRQLRDQVFASGNIRSQLALTSQSVDLMRMEAAQVAVYNGSGQGGLAESTAAYLQTQGMLIAATGNADVVSATTIYDYTGNPYTVEYLMGLMGVQPGFIFSRYDPSSTVDVEVVIGPEWVLPAQ